MENNQIIFSKIWLIFVICLSCINFSKQDKMLGAYSSSNKNNCDEAFSAVYYQLILNELFEGDLSITSCKIQVVAGLNFKMNLINDYKETFQMVIWKKLDGTYNITKFTNVCCD